MRRRLGELVGVPAGTGELRAGLPRLERVLAPRRVGVRRPPLVEPGGHQLGELRVHVQREGLGQRHGELQRTRRDLRPHLRAICPALLVQLEHLLVRAGGHRQQRRIRERHADLRLQVVEVGDADLLPRGERRDAQPAPRRAPSSSASISARSAKRLGTGLPSTPAVGRREARGEAGRSRLASPRAGPPSSGRSPQAWRPARRRRRPSRRAAARCGPRRRRSSARARDARPTSRYSGKVAKSHGTPASRVGDVHVLDVLERAGDQVAVLGPGGGDGEAAVAGHDRGDAVEARRGERRVPEHLGVVVGVDVDEAGGDDVPRRRRAPDRPTVPARSR